MILIIRIISFIIAWNNILIIISIWCSCLDAIHFYWAFMSLVRLILLIVMIFNSYTWGIVTTFYPFFRWDFLFFLMNGWAVGLALWLVSLSLKLPFFIDVFLIRLKLIGRLFLIHLCFANWYLNKTNTN